MQNCPICKTKFMHKNFIAGFYTVHICNTYVGIKINQSIISSMEIVLTKVYIVPERISMHVHMTYVTYYDI